MNNSRMAMNDFFTSVQAKALKQVIIAVHSKDDALDILQESMIKLAENYSNQEENWPKLFQRILQNKIRDYFRKKKVRNIIVWWDQQKEDDRYAHEIESNMEDIGSSSDAQFKLHDKNEPEKANQREQTIQHIHTAVEALPLRQQQAFLLRAWWGHDVEETAFAMRCSSGSVKTHYSRAINKLKEYLGDYSYEAE